MTRVWMEGCCSVPIWMALVFSQSNHTSYVLISNIKYSMRIQHCKAVMDDVTLFFEMWCDHVLDGLRLWLSTHISAYTLGLDALLDVSSWSLCVSRRACLC